MSSGQTTSGKTLFYIAAYLNFIYISIVSIKSFSAIIAEEKEQGTLGLLMITPRHPISLIAAKAVPLFFEVVASFLIELPFLLLCITLGGVELKQVLLLLLLIPFHAIFFASIAIYFSTISKDIKSAIALSSVFCGAFYVAPSIIDNLLRIFFPNFTNISFSELFAPFNSFTVLDKILNFQGAYRVLGAFAISITFLLFISLLICVKILKSMDLTTTAKEQNNTVKSSSVKRKRRAWDNALVGKEFQLGGGKKSIFIKAIGYPILILAFAYISKSLNQPEAIASIATVVFLALSGLELLVYAGQSFAVEHKEKQLSSLLSLQLSNTEIIFKKLKGAFILSLVPICFFLLCLFTPNEASKNILAFCSSVHILTVLSIAASLYFSSIYSGLTGKIKKTFAQQASMLTLTGLTLIIIIYPLIELYDKNKYIGAIACTGLAFFYCKYLLHLTSKWMTRLAQQEN
ncbi:MAG: hypothetical protein NE330_14575 [Lentisphaeraceae bacterium]|nr:hypothetical protein [Lentisphaeraceae bacterium]